MPREISLTPTTCLVWLFDDGCASSDRITFSTHTFLKDDVDYLIHLLDEIGIRGKRERVSKPPKDPDRKEPYWLLQIYAQNNFNNFFQYCKQGDPRLVRIMEKHYAHKFEV